MMITWIRNRSIARQFVDYPIIELLRECRRAIGLDVPKCEGDMRPSKPKVLFIEDHADTRELVWHVLTRENYEVQLAENAEQGALLAQSESFDLYMIDNWMPGTSGVDLCAKLRKFDTQTPILFFSGAAYEQDRREAMAAGAQGYLTKPANIGDLLGEVSRLIQHGKSRAAYSQILAVE
jgi:two-component system OmpR family response regulator